jgi:hypothetical protein
MDHLADDLPTYRVNILAKIADVRGAGKEDRSRSFRDDRRYQDRSWTIERSRRERRRGRRGHIRAGHGFLGLLVAWSDRRSLGDRRTRAGASASSCCSNAGSARSVDWLFGHGQLTVTTKAFDEAGTRVSRQLLMQSVVNLVYGIVAALGLYFSGAVPVCLGCARCRRSGSSPTRTRDRRWCADPGELAALPGWAGPLW